MDLLLLVLRLVHILFSAVWVGTVVFNTFLLAPALGDLGPDGGKVMGALQRRGMMTYLPVVALVSMLSGLWLFWNASLGLNPDYLRSSVGHAFGLGGLAAIAAYLIGIMVMRPAMLRVTGLAQSMAQLASDEERTHRQREIQALRIRASTAGRVVAVLLILATAAMAVARYL